MKSPKKTHIMLRVFFVVACLSLIGMLVGQHKSFTTNVKVHGGSFHEGLIGAPRFINPVLAQTQTDRDITRLVFGSLLTIQADKIHYDLADHLKISDDNKEYTLDLKKNLYFHNGDHITADDLIFTIEKIQDPLIKSPLYVRWQGVKAEKIDTYTVQFKLSTSYVDFPHNLNIGILPKNVWKNIGTDEFIFNMHNDNPIGSGAYQISGKEIGADGVPQSYTLNNKGNMGRSYISNITFTFFDNQDARVQAYNDGNIDTMFGVSQHENKLAIGSDTEIYTGIMPSVFGVFFNQNNNPLLKDNDIRKAVLHSLNTRQIIEQVYQNDAIHISDFTGTPSREDNYQPEKAQKLLEKDDWVKNVDELYEKNGQLLAFTLSIPKDETLRQFAEYMQINLRRNGISMNIKSFDEGEFTQNIIRPRDYEAIFFGYKKEKDSELYAFWHSSQKNDPGLNISLYSNKNIDKAMQSLRINTDSVDLQDVAEQINRDTPALFLFSPTYTYLLPTDIKDVEVEVTAEEDRFNNIANWYIKTRHVWDIFLK